MEEETKVEVGDVKCENIIKNCNGDATVIDFGMCRYVGGATCKICKADIACGDIDVHGQQHVAEYFKMRGHAGPLSRLRLQEFCYSQCFC